MKISLISVFLFTLLGLVSCSPKTPVKINLVPKPVELVEKNGTFVLSAKSTVETGENEKLQQLEDYAQSMIEERTGFKLAEGEGTGLKFELIEDEELGEEGYLLSVNKNGILIAANTPAGLFYGLQTFRQLLPTEPADEVVLPYLEIKDYPRLAWRGLHLDVGRHFFSVDDVKRYIDLMSMYKINTFHWHLTEDQGWRIEIKKYPRLTEVGSYRKKIGFEANQEKGLNVDDGKPYGGFYMQEEVKDIVEYARLRNVTIVPEIEMPGHSMAAMVAYPELYCFPDEKLEVRTEGGVSNGVYCAGKEETFDFLEDVLDEVMSLFPSEIIHIGGDEAPKTNWEKCPLCQKRIKDESLQDEHELQSYFIKRIEKYLNSKGRRLVGWDEIMEGGLSGTATVMAWRGVTPGIEAAELGNDVIMTPGTPFYLNRPQSINKVTKHEGSVNTMRDIYEFNPVPAELSPKARKHIIGVQACQWSEGTPNRKILEYKVYPRALAVAEMGWTPQEQRVWDDFYNRVEEHLPQLSFYGVDYGQRSYDVKINVVPGRDHKAIFADFITEVREYVYYTVDGSEPTPNSPVYDGTLEIKETGTLKARMFRPDGSAGRLSTQEVNFHKALGKVVTYNIPYSSKHDGGGDYAMTNGLKNKWQGFEKRNVDFVIDLGEMTEFSKIETNWYYDINDWVFRPMEVKYELSDDGENFETVYESTHVNAKNVYDKGTLSLSKEIENGKARYIRVTAKNPMVNPAWHSSAGGATWLFIDEVIVD
nr:glycoside hydrolase family 20 protein [uncultured Draconibacterium sp.]